MALRTAALAGIMIALIVAACSGGGGDETPATQTEAADPASATVENDFAESMLLTLTDFPAGWVHEPDDSDADSEASTLDPLEACFDDQYDGQTGSAIGGEFSDENTTLASVNPSVYIFESAAAAQEAAETIVASVQCIADLIGDGLEIDETFALGRTYTEPIAAVSYEATSAIRMYQTLISKSQEPPRTDVLVFDVVIVVDGRVLYEVEGFQRESPIDQSLLKLYVDKARAKIRQEP